MGDVPALGLTLALSFGFYGLVRKMAPLGSLEGLTLETAFAFPVALLATFYFAGQGDLTFVNGTCWDKFWLIMAGPITTIPLILFAYGLKQVVFFIGLFFFGEELQVDRLIGFILIWAGVLIFVGENFFRSRPGYRSELN